MPSDSRVSAEPKLRRDAQRNRDRLIAAAREVFADQGLHASLEEIAKRAGVRVGTLYHRFDGRTGLIDAVYRDRVDASVQLVEQALTCSDAWQGLVEHLTAIAQWQAEDRGFTEVCVYTFPDDLAIAKAKARGHELTKQLVHQAHRTGVLRRDVGLADIGLLTWAVVQATRNIRNHNPDAWRRHLSMVFDALRPEAAHQLPGTPLDPAHVQLAMKFPA